MDEGMCNAARSQATRGSARGSTTSRATCRLMSTSCRLSFAARGSNARLTRSTMETSNARQPKRKLDKVARKTIVAAQRSVQGARENIYRLRGIVEMAMEVDTVEASIIAQAEAAHAALATAESAIEQCLARISRDAGA
jgi:hypothetical protein